VARTIAKPAICGARGLQTQGLEFLLRLALLLRPHVPGHGGERGDDHPEVIRQAQREQDVRDGVDGEDEIAKRADDGRARPRRQVVPLEGVEEPQRLLQQFAAGPLQQAAQLPPEAVLGVALW